MAVAEKSEVLRHGTVIDVSASKRPDCGGCCLCGSTSFSRPFPARHPWLVRCRCGLVFALPQPSDEELAEIYSPRYYEPFGVKRDGMEGYRAMKQANAHRILSVAEKFISRGRLLDVGSALGDVMIVAQARGWDALGVEPHCRAVELANEVLPNKTIHLAFEDLAFDSVGRFDLITCLDVLEHLRQPRTALAHVRQLLTEKGIAIVSVPDIGSLSARLSGARWPHFHRDHLWYLSRRTLTTLLIQCGFVPLCISRAWKVLSLQYILGILQEHDHIGMVSRWAGRMLRVLPQRLATTCLSPIPEGLLAIAKKMRD